MRVVTDVSVGYSHPAYIDSLYHVGEPVRLQACGGWLLRRPIPDSDLHDCIGPYPLFACCDWARLPDDLAALRDSGAVSATLVPDPFGVYSPQLLESTFDVVRAVKRRWIVDLRTDLERVVSPHHRRRAARALGHMEIDRCAEPRRHAEEWSTCYRAFAADRRMSGAANFPEQSLVQPLSVPGLLMYRASSDDRTLGFSLWMVHGPHAYGHLAAYTDEGRRSGVAYAFHWEILRDLRALGVELVDLGGGIEDDDGLARWKSGWTAESRPSLVCGAILRPEAYDALARARAVAKTSFFPSYRSPADP